jgi:hypothetical protein
MFVIYDNNSRSTTLALVVLQLKVLRQQFTKALLVL